MLSTATTDAYADQITYELSLHEFLEKKLEGNYKETILKKIVSTVCAMMNCNGGRIVVNINANSDISVSQLSLAVRIIEQHLISIIGTNITAAVNFEDSEDKKSITIFVEKAASLITIDYHLFVPSRTQVIQWQPLQPQEKVKNEIINRSAVDNPVQLESHQKLFVQGKKSGLHESKTVQLKNVKAEASKRTKLADRMTGKSNKFNYYVSAFANYKGGHIYYGIDDDGIVKGELIERENEKKEITKRVEKSIKKMIWPEQPKRNVHWEIFFEPVLDDNSTPIPSTFVIVIYIASCLGGVFTEVPECYEMVKEEVVKMSLITWKEKILRPVELFHLPITDSTVIRSTWSSSRIERICSQADEALVTTLNEGKSIQTIANNLEKKNPGLIEVQLLISAKKVMASYRSNSFGVARKLLGEYEFSLKSATEFWMFEAIRVYLETVICFVQGDIEAVNNILPNVIIQAESIKRGRISAALYLLAAAYLPQPNGDDNNSPVVFLLRALEDLKHDKDVPTLRADLEQKCHIYLALFYLGCNKSRMPNKSVISVEKASCSIDAVNQSIDDGYLMIPYREVHFKLIRSILFYRKSQIQPKKKMFFLKAAFDASKKAETLAIECDFQDLVDWSRDCMALFTESLIRTTLQLRKTRK